MAGRKFWGVVAKDASSAYGIWFPDVPGCFGGGDSFEAALKMAAKALGGSAIAPGVRPSPLCALDADTDVIMAFDAGEAIGLVLVAEGSPSGQARGQATEEVKMTENDKPEGGTSVTFLGENCAPKEGAQSLPSDDGSQAMPTVGRIVHYHASVDEISNGTSLHAAIITQVWSPDCVNLRVMPDCAPDFHATSVMRGLDAEHWSWPPRV